MCEVHAVDHVDGLCVVELEGARYKLSHLAPHMRFDPFGELEEQFSDKSCGNLQPPECFADTALGGGLASDVRFGVRWT